MGQDAPTGTAHLQLGLTSLCTYPILSTFFFPFPYGKFVGMLSIELLKNLANTFHNTQNTGYHI